MFGMTVTVCEFTSHDRMVVYKLYIYFAPGGGAKYCDERVCMSERLYVYL